MLETVGSLKRNFKQIFTSEYGDCLLIPLRDWKPEWKNGLMRQGHQIIEQLECARILIRMEYSATIAQEAKDLPDEETPISSKIDDNSSSKIDEVKVRKGIVSGANVAAAAAKIPKHKPETNLEHKRGRPRGCGGRRATGNWKPEAEKQLIEAMGHRDIVALPMLHRARLIIKQKPDLFPGRTALALTQHYKQITTPAQRATALAESLKPPVDKITWENLNCRQEKYSLEKDGLKLTALVIMEKGAIQRISAVVTPQTEGNSEVKAFLVNELPVDVLKLLYSLVEQLQQEPQP